MAKKQAARRRPAQLKTMTWPDRNAALRDLKASGVAERGEDYELGEYKPGSWMLLDRSAEEPAAAPAEPAIREDSVLALLRKKPGAAARGAPAIVLDAKAPKPGKAKAPAKGGSPAPEPPAAPAEAEAPVTPAAPPVSPYSPLPASEGPYECIVRAEDGSFPNNAVVAFAQEFSRKMRMKVHIRDGKGEIVRSIDAAAIRAAQKGERGRPKKDGGPSSTGKSAEAAKLLMRPQGATFAEIVQITEWSVSERFVRRLGRSHKCEPEMVEGNPKHWRLIKAD